VGAWAGPIAIEWLPEQEKAKLARMLVEKSDWLEDALDAAIAKARMNEPERLVSRRVRTCN